jgi:hypothetical protein
MVKAARHPGLTTVLVSPPRGAIILDPEGASLLIVKCPRTVRRARREVRTTSMRYGFLMYVADSDSCGH